MSLLQVRIRFRAEGFTSVLGRSKSLYFRTMYGFHKEPAATDYSTTNKLEGSPSLKVQVTFVSTGFLVI